MEILFYFVVIWEGVVESYFLFYKAKLKRLLTFKINVLKSSCHSVIITWSFHLQGIMTVTFEVLGDIKEENLNLFIQVNNTSRSTEQSL